MSKAQVTIIDYGVGNTHSVANAIGSLGYKVKISDQPTQIEQADVLILPGVGAFNAAISNLRSRNLEPLLNELVLVRKKPILGICVGMQMMATHSEENGLFEGLNWIKGRVIKLDIHPSFAVPHVGWNNIIPIKKELLFNAANETSNFYFDHSYYFKTERKEDVAAEVEYDKLITAAVQHENICGVQFHPEKSQTTGLKLFRSYITSVLKHA